jgi:predicted DNA binding CopG/RHH family protein
VPRFASNDAAADFFETHDLSGAADELKAVRPIRLPPGQVRKIQQRHARRKTAISIRLQPEQIAAAKKVAARKSIGYQTQLRLWIAEGIGREAV